MLRKGLWTVLYGALGAAATIVEAPTNEKLGDVRAAPAGPQLGKRPKPPRQGGPGQWLVLGAALAAGIALAKALDWRGHGHPRD